MSDDFELVCPEDTWPLLAEAAEDTEGAAEEVSSSLTLLGRDQDHRRELQATVVARMKQHAPKQLSLWGND